MKGLDDIVRENKDANEKITTAKIYLKSFKEQMLDKYPNMLTITNCENCNADLRYLNKIHRIDMEWYCDKCYKKYKRRQK